jgi:hypothetical protein
VAALFMGEVPLRLHTLNAHFATLRNTISISAAGPKSFRNGMKPTSFTCGRNSPGSSRIPTFYLQSNARPRQSELGY